MQNVWLKEMKQKEKEKKLTKFFLPITMVICGGFGIWMAILATN